jgi:hypothetical protein
MPRKPKTKTGSYKVFEINLERSRAFLRIFDKEPEGGRRRGQPTRNEKELLRGSLVFAVGALDAYLHDLILEIVPTFAPKSPHLTVGLREISKSDPGLALRVALAASGQDRREEFRTALSEWLENKSFQGAEKVSNALGYVGCPLTWPDFDKATGTSAATELTRITKQRHDIVHRGQQPYVRRDLAEETLNFIATVAEVVDQSICEQYL